MSIEAALGLIITLMIAFVGALLHHIAECRKIQRQIGRILQRLGMSE